jgi:hypothetical protein
MRPIHVTFAALASGALIGASLPSCSDSDDGCRGAECSSDGGEGGTSTAGSGGRGGISGGGTGAVGGDGVGGATSSGGASGDGGEGGAGAGGRGPQPCDVNASPSVEACLVNEEFAVFVTPQGDDAADGTRDEPVATVAHAILLAQEQNKLVIACAGTFDERITLRDGVRVYGGFTCPGGSGAREPWTYDGETKTTVAPSSRGVTIEVRDVASAIVIEDFEFDALNATEPGESSIAALIVRAADVTLRRVRILAGDGQRGEDGTRAGFVYPSLAELRGNDGATVLGGASELCTMCPGMVLSRPGGGGDQPNEDGGEGQPIFDDSEEEGPHEGGAGLAALACNAGGAGRLGAQGSFGSSALGAISLGRLTIDGWFPAPGVDAPHGSPGQGGGGGAGKAGGGGGSGGCGGCGGRGGAGGKGGGASIGLAALRSVVTVEHSEIRAGRAGDGGAGAPGQIGQGPGGAGGLGFGNGSDRGCNGGPGGSGGDGGPGGGGAGGISVGILYRGDAPTVDEENSITPGTAGVKGIGGGIRGEAGVEGVAREILEIVE